MMIFLIILQMQRELVDPLAQNRHLYLRATGILSVSLSFGHDDLLFLCCKHVGHRSTGADKKQVRAWTRQLLIFLTKTVQFLAAHHQKKIARTGKFR